MKHPFQPCYCEENVWHLCQAPELAGRDPWVVLLTNAERLCPVWAQQGDAPPGEPILWDYHAIVLVGGPPWEVWDLNSMLGAPVDLAKYLRLSFPRVKQWPEHLRPRFRVLTAGEYLRHFSSDRSHMLDDEGGYYEPPPPWPLICDSRLGMTLPLLLDPEQPHPGEWLDWRAFIGRFKP